MKKGITQNRDELQSLWRRIQLRYELSVIHIKNGRDSEFGL